MSVPRQDSVATVTAGPEGAARRPAEAAPGVDRGRQLDAYHTRHLAPSPCATWRPPVYAAAPRRRAPPPRPLPPPERCQFPELADARVGDDAAGVAAVAVDPDAAEAGLLGAGDVAQGVVAHHGRVARVAGDGVQGGPEDGRVGLGRANGARGDDGVEEAGKAQASSFARWCSSVPFVTTARRIRPRSDSSTATVSG